MINLILTNSFNYITKIDIDFVPLTKGHRKIAGFFPYINESDIDLSRFGIYKNLDESDINESCLYKAFESAKILNSDELALLHRSIITRLVPQTSLNEIAELFNIHIHCAKYYNETGKTSYNDYTPKNADNQKLRRINLIVMFDHYMLDSDTNVSSLYIKKYHEINNDNRFINHLRKQMLSKFSDKRYEFAKNSIPLVKMIKLMIEHKLLIPMTDEQINMLTWSFNPSISPGSISRLVKIADKADSYYKQIHRVSPTRYLFGYKPTDDEIEFRLNELQSVNDEFELRHPINVKLYYKYSELMQKLMFEFGCYDNVYEFNVDLAQSIRQQCIFSKHNNQPYYTNNKMYYIDLNGAYISCIKGIPTGQNPTESTELNTKLADLINKLYSIRQRAKSNGNDKLATTLKFMMTSCWGYSIRRPKIIKHKYNSNIDSYIDNFAPFVLRYNYINDSDTSGFVDTINSFVPHFTTPHLAKHVLDEFHNLMNKIKSLVTVYYQNVDAILINESDYNKLVELGYIGNQLGQFKIEHIFTEFALSNGRQYVAKLDNGEQFYHCVNKSIDYDSFVTNVKNKLTN